MIIRKATVKDINALSKVHCESWKIAYKDLLSRTKLHSLNPAGFAPFWKTRLSNPDSTVLVVELKKIVKGFISFGKTRDADQDPHAVAEIYALYLSPNVWGQGYGKSLFQEAYTQLAKEAYSSVTLWVLDENLRAKHFYESIGFISTEDSQMNDSLGSLLKEIRYYQHINP